MGSPIGWRDVIGEVSYGASLVLSDNQVVIDKYSNPSKNLGSYYEGAKLGDIRGFTTIGIAQSQEEMDAHLAKVDRAHSEAAGQQVISCMPTLTVMVR